MNNHCWDTYDHNHLTLWPSVLPFQLKINYQEVVLWHHFGNPSMLWLTPFNSITCRCVTLSLHFWDFWCSLFCEDGVCILMSWGHIYFQNSTQCALTRDFSVEATVWVLVWFIDHSVDKVEALLTVLLSLNFTLFLIPLFHLSPFTFQVLLFFSPFYGRRFSIFLKLWYQRTPGLSLGNLPLSNLSV